MQRALYPARHGWDTTGVELVGHAVETARNNADGLPVRFVQGVVQVQGSIRQPISVSACRRTTTGIIRSGLHSCR